MNYLIEGTTVHYVMPNGQFRPAIIVKVWNNNGLCNLQVFSDGSNDLPYTAQEKEQFSNYGLVAEEVRHGHFWKTSISYSPVKVEPNTWHYIGE